MFNKLYRNKTISHGAGAGSVDAELGLALKYKNFSNIGDIVFDNKYSTDTVDYTTTSRCFIKCKYRLC